MTEPLVFRHGPAETAFIVAMVAWVVFEMVIRAAQRLRACGPAARDPSFAVLLATQGLAGTGDADAVSDFAQ